MRRRSDRIPAIAELKGAITRNLTQDHWLPGFNFNVEEWDAEGRNYETLAICRTLALARAAFNVAIAEKPAGRFMIRHCIRVVKRKIWNEKGAQ